MRSGVFMRALAPALLVLGISGFGGGLSSTVRIQVLYSFADGVGGGGPATPLVPDGRGILYGTTNTGGADGHGALFELRATKGRWQETVLHSFGSRNDGSLPQTDLSLDARGDIFGTTAEGGRSANCPSGCGTVFELVRSQSGWREVVLHDFTGGADGYEPVAGVVVHGHGDLYGTTEYGGRNSTVCSGGCGTVFELTPERSAWSYRVLYDFRDIDDGNVPDAPMTFGPDASLYGTTLGGGNGDGCIQDGGCGTVFGLRPTAHGWKESVLYRFRGTGGDGAYPLGGMVWGPQGALVGTTTQGGIQRSRYTTGSVFELRPVHGTWKEEIVYRFRGGANGYFPLGTLISGLGGDLYGVTLNGGNSGCSHLGCGTVFRLHRSGQSWEQTVLCDFPGGTGGWDPLAGLARAGDDLFGTTADGGGSDYGVAFEVGVGAGRSSRALVGA